MAKETYEKGHGNSRPYFIIDEDTGGIIPVYLSCDAVCREAMPGEKAGNPLLDEINEQLKDEGLVKRLKELYKIEKKKS